MSFDSAAQRVWEAALGRLQIQVPRPSFDTWFRGTVGASLTDQTLSVNVRSTFVAEWLELRMLGLIEAAASAVARRPIKVIFHVTALAEDEPGTPLSPHEGNAPTPPPLSPHQGGVPAQLNANYSFDAFVIGQSNRLAYAAAMAVADAPGAAYNPLFLYGPVGVGKTHLLHAVGLHAQQRGYHVQYVTAEQFTNEFLTALRLRKMEAFRERYRSTDVLLVDDIQFLAGKEGTQEGFFHTFNALHMAGRQVVLAADRAPTALPLIEERLRSRFESGLATDVGTPDYETRIAILQRLASSAPVKVARETVELVAAQAKGNVRQLVGYLNKVTALAHFTNTSATPDIARTILPQEEASPPERLSPPAILQTVAQHYAVPVDALTGQRRDRPISEARQLCMLLLHDWLQMSPSDIGVVLGNRHRATILHGLREAKKRVEANPAIGALINDLRACAQQETSTLSTGLVEQATR